MEVILSRKRAKSRTRGRKLRLTGAKARLGRVRKTRADLEQQLKACRRDIAHARERLVEAMKQQNATSCGDLSPGRRSSSASSRKPRDRDWTGHM